MKLNELITEKNLMISLAATIIAVTIIDIFTAINSPMLKLAEANPIFMIFGNIIFTSIIAIFFSIFIIYKIKKSLDLSNIFVFVLIAIYLTAIHIFGAYTNVSVVNDYYENPEKVMERYEKIDQQTKIKWYFKTIFGYVIIPINLSFLAFTITQYFHKKRKRGREKIIDGILKKVEEINKMRVKVE